jgi:GT2 family glycosyltransferase
MIIKVKVVVVDNASTDGSAEAINSEYPAAHLIKNEINLGAIVGRNVGWRFAEKNFDFEYLLFLDNDVIIDKHFVTKLVDLLNTNEQIGIASGKAYTNRKLSTIMSAGLHVNLYTGSIYDMVREIDIGQHDQLTIETPADALFNC